MAQATTLVLKDRLAANVNYYPVLIETGTRARYEDRTNSKLALQSHAQLSFSDNPGARFRVVKGSVDYLTENPVTGTIDVSFGDISFRLNKAHTKNEFLEVLSRLRAMIDDAIVQAAVENGENPW